jgi:hypothetical protein
MKPDAARASRVVLCLVVLACARQTATSSRLDVAPPDNAPRVRQPTHMIDASEIISARATNALDAVRKLRPEMLSRRGTVVRGDPYAGKPVVYLDRTCQGSFDTLESIPTSMILDIRYLNAASGNDWVGAYHPGGVILVRTRR